MIVHFDAPSPVASQNMGRYSRVIATIRAAGHEVSNAWNESSYIEMAHSLLDAEDWRALCKKSLESLNAADVAIFDCSNKGVFGIGYQAALALGAGKPTLLLIPALGQRGSFVSGLEHPLLTRKEFSETGIEEVVGGFLRECSLIVEGK